MVRYLLNLLWMLLLTAMASGQPVSSSLQAYTHPPYHQYTLRDGLPQMQITDLFQDSRGYLWAGTKGGLTCFNGGKFVSFTRQEGLTNDYIFDITEDFCGNIWFSTSAGLACYNGHVLECYDQDETRGSRIAASSDGRIWTLSYDPFGKAYFGYFSDGSYTSMGHLMPQDIREEPVNEVIWSEKEKALLLYTSHAIHEIKDDRHRLLHMTRDTLFKAGVVSGEIIFAECADRNNVRLLAYTDSHLEEKAHIRNRRLRGKNLLPGKFIFSGPFWFFPLVTLDHDRVDFEDPHPKIHKNCFLVAEEGVSWVGSEEGLVMIFGNGIETWNREILPNVWGIIEDHSGNIWFSSYFTALKSFDGNRLTNYPDFRVNNAMLSYYFRPSVDKQGRLFFPSSQGIIHFNGTRYRQISKSISLTTFYDPERELLWSGSHRKAEAYDKNLRLVRSIGEQEGMINERFVVSIAKDRQGWTWLANLAGISRYHWDTRQIVNYNRANGRLPAEGVLSVYTDPMGTTWMGSTNGLLQYDPLTDSIRTLNLPDITGPVNFVTSLDSTWLVFSQPAGIYLTDLRAYYRSGQMNLRFYNEENGFMGIEPGQDGAFVDSRGNLWMTTGTEVVRLDPRQLDTTSDTLRIRVSSCNGQLLPYQTSDLILPRNSLNAILTFDAICFNRPRPVQYSWRIAGRGREKSWSDWSENDYVVLSGLSLRKNVIEVRARIPGLPLKAPASTLFILETRVALWRQAWFFPALFGLVTFLSLVTLVLLLRTHTRMALANRQAKKFQVQAIQSQMNPHFIFNALASLQTMILQADPRKANDYLVKLAALIRGFLESSLATGYLKGDNHSGEVPLKEELGILNHYIDFQQLIYPGRFTYQLTIDPSIDPASLTIPPMLIQPFAENAIRHGLLQKKGEGHLKVTIRRGDSGEAVITIEDDGIGIEKSRSIHKKSPMRYVSRGRELTLNRIKLMNETGYHISVDTRSSDLGTTVTIHIKNHGE